MGISRGFKVLKVVFRDRRSHFHISRWPFAFDSYCPHFYISHESDFFFSYSCLTLPRWIIVPIVTSYQGLLARDVQWVCSYQRVATPDRMDRVRIEKPKVITVVKFLRKARRESTSAIVVTLVQEYADDNNSVFFFPLEHRTNSRADKNRLYVYFRWFRVLMMSQHSLRMLSYWKAWKTIRQRREIIYNLSWCKKKYKFFH